MIETIFKTHALIKDLDISQEVADQLDTAVATVLADHVAKTGESHREYGENNLLPFFTEETIKSFPHLSIVRDYFVDGFWELAQSYTNTPFTRESIEKLVSAYTGRLPIMKNGDYKNVHTHSGALAFGILYLNDVDNEKHGGELILHDPSFSTVFGFGESPHYKVPTKKHRLIIAPANVWHSVTPYTGEEDRVAVVFNLDLINLKTLSV
jgi:Rps23 Pro-64 3,4-dihydroxylase Tpa1-like proline 4-hydroxylase